MLHFPLPKSQIGLLFKKKAIFWPIQDLNHGLSELYAVQRKPCILPTKSISHKLHYIIGIYETSAIHFRIYNMLHNRTYASYTVNIKYLVVRSTKIVLCLMGTGVGRRRHETIIILRTV